MANDAVRVLPPWQTVYSYLRRWEPKGVWQKIHAVLR